MQKHFDGLIFDMGDILYDASAWRRWLARELTSRGCPIAFDALVERWEELLRDVYRGKADYWERFRGLLDAVGLPDQERDDLERAARLKAAEVQLDRVPMKGVPETLETLADAGVKMAVLSDTENGRERVTGLLAELGLESFFDAVVSSADAGWVKPEPEAYRLALQELELEEDRCAFVGHDADELEGALAAGLYAIAYNYHPDAPANVRLSQFSELLDIVLVSENG